MFLAAGRAALEVGAKAGHRSVRVGSGYFQLDVAVELGEALVAAELGLAGAEQARKALLELGAVRSSLLRSASARSRTRPDACGASGAHRGASCRAHLGCSPSRSARTSIGTPFRAPPRARVAGEASARWRSPPGRRASSSLRSASSLGVGRSLAKRHQVSGSSGISRPCQARRRSFTAASRSANLYTQVVKRLAPRKSSSRARTETSASSAASSAMSSSSFPRRCGSVGRLRATSKRAARRRSAWRLATAASCVSPPPATR